MSLENFDINYSSEKITSKIIYQKSLEELSKILLEDNSDVHRLFVTDATVASLPIMQEFTSKFDDDKYGNNYLLVLGSGEPYKNFETVLTIAEKALEYGFTRNDVFVAIGGGVICDTTAFAASIFKRGIAVELVPTTIVCMIDSAIGGKTSCNHANHKNIIGTYYPATKIYYVSQFIEYLSNNQLKSGLGEAIKTAIILNKDLYNIFKTESEKIIARDKETLEKIISMAAKSKADLVQRDFKDQNDRLLLNLGHTFAYALETIVGMGVITHGEAVAWGISRAVSLAWKKGYCSEVFKNELFELLEVYGYTTDAIPSIVKGGGIGDRILEAMHEDKKNTKDTVSVVIPHGIEKVTFENVSDEELLSVLK